MKQNLFGEKVNYERFGAPFVLIGLINRFENRYQAAADAFFRDLSWKQMYFLNVITMFEQAPTMQDVANMMGCSHQNVNKLSAKLLREGYIIAVKDENDRRKQRLFLTDKASAFLSRNREEGIRCVKEIFDVISNEETETAINIIAKLNERLFDLYGGSDQ